MKKLLVLLLLITSTLSLTSCGKKSEEKDIKKYVDNAQKVVTIVSSITSEEEEQFLDARDELLDLTLIQAKIPLTAKSLKSVINSWNSAIEDFGKMKKYSNPKLVTEQGKSKIIYDAVFEDRKADITIAFDNDYYVTDININGHYTKSEIAKKAALNTVLGMGTVFAMLILISLVISLFKFIPNINNANNKVKSDIVNKTQEEKNEEVINENNDVLVAVISAAISSYTKKSTDDFIVRSIKKNS